MTDRDLLLAILSLDSYNRGYGEGIVHGRNQIGTAAYADQSSIDNTKPGVIAGFYAASYTLDDGTTVISYRGTDGNTLTDVFNGWVAATGTETSQTTLALDFYNTIADGAKSDLNSKPVITTTGHGVESRESTVGSLSRRQQEERRACGHVR